MANFNRIKVWSFEEVLTNDDLNAEFDNIINNLTFGTTDAENIDLTDDYAWTGIHTFANKVTVAGTWELPFQIGRWRMWDDTTTNVIRLKMDADPSSVTDGTIIMEG